MYNTLEGYVQDTWRVKPHFTFDYGLRFSYLGPVHDPISRKNISNPTFRIRAGGAAVYSGDW